MTMREHEKVFTDGLKQTGSCCIGPVLAYQDGRGGDYIVVSLRGYYARHSDVEIAASAAARALTEK